MKEEDDDIQEYVRPWVGLTKNEVELLSYLAEGNTWIAVELAEAKLKEKNT
jgi:DNA-binding CsgD family transcriptional regulator